MFAYAHNKVEKLSGQLLLDVVNCLPGFLKRCHLDCLKQVGLDLNQPGFNSLRKFIVNELSIMTSEDAKPFLYRMKRKSLEALHLAHCVLDRSA